MRFNPSIYGPISSKSVRRCTVLPDGPCTADSTFGPAVVGPKSIGHWTTSATVLIPSKRVVPEERYVSLSSTRGDTIDTLTQLITEVVLPRATAVAERALSHTDMYPALTIAHVDETGIDWDDLVFIAKLTVPCLMPDVRDLSINFTDPIPPDVNTLVQSLVSAYVVGAVAEETGLLIDGA